MSREKEVLKGSGSASSPHIISPVSIMRRMRIEFDSTYICDYEFSSGGLVSPFYSFFARKMFQRGGKDSLKIDGEILQDGETFLLPTVSSSSASGVSFFPLRLGSSAPSFGWERVAFKRTIIPQHDDKKEWGMMTPVKKGWRLSLEPKGAWMGRWLLLQPEDRDIGHYWPAKM